MSGANVVPSPFWPWQPEQLISYTNAKPPLLEDEELLDELLEDELLDDELLEEELLLEDELEEEDPLLEPDWVPPQPARQRTMNTKTILFIMR